MPMYLKLIKHFSHQHASAYHIDDDGVNPCAVNTTEYVPHLQKSLLIFSSKLTNRENILLH